MAESSHTEELERLRSAFGEHQTDRFASRYSPLLPEVNRAVQALERALIRWIEQCGIAPLDQRRLLEIGCGSGSNLLRFLSLGFRPENLVGNELVPARADIARRSLPAAVAVYTGNAADLDLENGSFDVVFQSTVFTSIFDTGLQEQVAHRMWRLARRGGGILWYDMAYDSPRARGIPLARVRQLFPGGRCRYWRVTLAPPISRFVTRVHPALYGLFNCLPLLRTHLLCWIEKSAAS